MKRGKFPSLLFAAVISVIASTASHGDEAKTYIGSFSNVAFSPESGDCDGISFQLWKERNGAGRQKITGTFFGASGECPGNAAHLSEAIIEATTGRTELLARDERTGLVVAAFKGTIRAKGMEGQFAYGDGANGVTNSWTRVKLKVLNARGWKRIFGADSSEPKIR